MLSLEMKMVEFKVAGQRFLGNSSEIGEANTLLFFSENGLKE